MWEYDPYHNSIITAGNGGTKPTQAAFTIFYNQGTQRYDLEQTLQPDEQMWIDVGKLIREHVPDKTGKVLPPELTMGSYEFRDLTNTGVGTLFEGKVIYDKTYGHVAYGCGICCGYYYPKVFFNPLLVPVGSTTRNGVTAYNQCTLKYDDVSGDFFGSWGGANTAIVTVDNYGTHTGVFAGSTTSGTSRRRRQRPTHRDIYRRQQFHLRRKRPDGDNLQLRTGSRNPDARNLLLERDDNECQPPKYFLQRLALFVFHLVRHRDSNRRRTK
jgi:hypothetical protein